MDLGLLGDSLLVVVRALAVPYGYTLALWSAGALAIARWGLPSRRQVLFFVAGAVLAYVLFDLPVLLLAGGPQEFAVRLPAAASLNVIPVLPALGAALLVTRIASKSSGFFLLGFAATSFYIAAFTLVLVAGDALTRR